MFLFNSYRFILNALGGFKRLSFYLLICNINFVLQVLSFALALDFAWSLVWLSGLLSQMLVPPLYSCISNNVFLSWLNQLLVTPNGIPSMTDKDARYSLLKIRLCFDCWQPFHYGNHSIGVVQLLANIGFSALLQLLLRVADRKERFSAMGPVCSQADSAPSMEVPKCWWQGSGQNRVHLWAH